MLLAASLAVCVGVLETGIRLGGFDSLPIWQPDVKLGWRHIPGAQQHQTDEGNGRVAINSQGLRDRERSVEKGRGVFRIMVLGDSMTEAVQVDLAQTYCHLLEARFRAAGRPVEVLNFGVSGYSLIQELFVLQGEGPRYRPDLVLLATFTDNDVADCDPELSTGRPEAPYVRADGEGLRFSFDGAEQNYREYQREPKRTLRRYCASYRWLSRRIRLLADRRQPGPGIPKRFLLYQNPLSPGWERGWETYERILLELAATARALPAAFAIVSVPAAQVVSARTWAELLRERPAMAGTAWDLDAAERRLAAIARTHSLELIEVLPHFRAADKAGTPLFFGRVGHFTPRGHEVMAQVLADALDRSKLVPAAVP